MDDADRADIQRSLAGDGAAFGRIIARHQGFVAGWMRRFARDSATLEELVHDVFVEAYFSLRSFRGEVPLERWLATLATRVGYRYWKRKARDRKTESIDRRAEVESREGYRDDWHESESLNRVLAQLSLRDRLVVTLLYLQGCSVAETAALTGWSQTMVKVQAFRARRKLRRIMEMRDRES